MRTVKIEYGEKLTTGNGVSVLCPMKTNGFDSYACNPQCTWFSIVTDRDIEKSNGENTVWADYACCKDHRIGKIEEEV